MAPKPYDRQGFQKDDLDGKQYLVMTLSDFRHSAGIIALALPD